MDVIYIHFYSKYYMVDIIYILLYCSQGALLMLILIFTDGYLSNWLAFSMLLTRRGMKLHTAR